MLSMGAVPAMTVAGEPIFDEASWPHAAPFVDRYLFGRQDGDAPIIVDEVNYWPLLFPLKCKMIVAPDSQLSGVDKTDLDYCHRNDGPYHDWLGETGYAKALEGPIRSRGGAVLNRSLKQIVMNWGFSDAVIALGPMRYYIRKALNDAFAFAAQYDRDGLDDQEFVVVSESLGSFVVMDAFGDTSGSQPGVRRVLSRTADLYFFANQFALLDLARVQGVPESSDSGPSLTPSTPKPPPPSALEALKTWASPRATPELERPEVGPPQANVKQIIAFSDPSDVLTFEVPKLDGATVVNVYDLNAFDFLGLVVFNVAKAHIGHSSNPAVLRMMFSEGGGLQK